MKKILVTFILVISHFIVSAQTDTIFVFNEIDSIPLCQVDSIFLTADSSGLTNPDFLWNNGDTVSTITVSQNGLYYVTVYTAIDTFIDSTFVFFDTIIDVTINDTIICPFSNLVPLSIYHPLGNWFGVGIQDDTFNISLAGGIGNYTVDYFVINGACIDTNQVNIEVRGSPNIMVSSDTITFCNTGIDVNLDSSLYSPLNGLWLGNGIVNQQAIFNPNQSGGLGINGVDSIHHVIYEIEDSIGCINQDTLSIRLIYGDTLILDNSFGICRNSGLDTLSKYAQISGAPVTWSGNGIIDANLGIFDPQLANVDTLNANTIFATQGVGSCLKIDSIQIFVGIPPTIYAGLDKSICINQGKDTLLGYMPLDTTNGYWSGIGIVDSIYGVINPQNMNIGFNTLTYAWNNPLTNCSVSDDIIVHIKDKPNVSVTPTIDTICNQDNILLTDYVNIFPQGVGSLWLGNGISAPNQGILSPNDPASNGQGSGDYNLTYVYSDSSFCSDTASMILHITDGTSINAGNDTAICFNNGHYILQATPQGGLWSSQLQGLIASTQPIFDPLLVGSGVTDTLIYTYDDGICINSDTILMSVENLPVVDIYYNDTICLNNGSYLLSGKYPSSGGVWLGSSAILNPLTGLYNPNSIGSDSLYYQYMDSFTGCLDSALKVITVDTVPNVYMLAIDSIYYRDDAAILLNGTPTNGIFFNPYGQTGITNNSGYTFNPQLTTTNSFEVHFTYTDNNNCTNRDTQTVAIYDRFAALSPNIQSLSNSSMDWGDYDNNGYLDLIIIGSNLNGRQTLIYQNNNGAFTTNSSVNNDFVQVDNGDVKWGDYDNDGDLDVAISGDVNSGIFSTTKIYENVSGNFIEDIQANSVLIALNGSRLEWSDIDSDGDLDLITLGQLSNSNGFSAIYENKKNEGLGFVLLTTLEPLHSGSIAVGDYDNDTDKDIFLTGISSSINDVATILYRNDTNNFVVVPAITGIGGGDADFGDYDGDGYLDLLVTGRFSNTGTGSKVSRIYKNINGSLFFNVTTGVNTLTPVDNGKVAWGDYDNDGDLDFIITGNNTNNNTGFSKLYRNNTGDTLQTLFDAVNISFIPIYDGDVTWGDYDNDGDLDIFLVGNQNSNSNDFKLYRNDIINTPNTIPTVPTGLQDTVILASGDVILSWNHSFDNNGTPYTSLSYNLCITDSLSLFDVHPMSNISDGYRRVVRRGNAGLNNIMRIKNLPEGKHYWKVQAVDNNFAGGLFSVVDSFDVRRILIDSLSEVLCGGSATEVHYTTIATDYFNTNNIFTVQLSDTSGDFSNPISVGTINSDTSSSVLITIPENIIGGTYKLRMVANSPFSVSLPFRNDITIHPVSGFEVVTNDSLFCNGNSIILSTSNNPLFTYQWKRNDTLIIGAVDTSFLQVSDTANFEVIITTNNGCIDSSNISTGFYSDPFPDFSVTENCLYETFMPQNLSMVLQDTITINQWFFGDGSSTFGIEPIHHYNQVDTFNIKLITTTSNGCQDSISYPIIIHPLPKASFEVEDICFEEDVLFTNSSLLPTYGTIDTFTWDFGDSTYSNFENPVHTYLLSDTFYVNLKAISDKGCMSDTTRKLTVHPLPFPSFYANNVCQYKEVDFDNRTDVITVPVDSFIWNFDDGYFSTDSLASHTYLIADTFNVNLIAITPFGCYADTTLPLVIYPEPVAGFYAVGNCNEDYLVQFYDTSSVQWGTIDDYQWDFGDGTQNNDINPLKEYVEDSVYAVTLITTTNNGCIDTITETTASVLLPIADFTFWKNPISLGDTLRPINNSLNGFSYFWDFGDTTITTDADTSIVMTPKYFYQDFGFYTVYLTVFNELGCQDTLSKRVKVQPRPRSDYEVITYPNPTYDGNVFLNIDLKDTVELNVEIYNALGQKVWNLRPLGESVKAFPPPDPFDLYTVEIDLTNQVSGVYFVSIIIDGIRYSTTRNITNGPLKGRNLNYNNSMKILLLKIP